MHPRNAVRAAAAAAAVATLQLGASAHSLGFALGEPVLVRSPATGSPLRYLIAADFDGDGRADLAAAGAQGVEILRNAGGEGPVPAFTAVQTISALYSSCGNAVDWDGDGDLDLVLGDTDDVLLALNSGGTFSVSALHSHGSGTAVGARGVVLGSGEDRVRFVVWAPDAPGARGEVLVEDDGAFRRLLETRIAHADWIDGNDAGLVAVADRSPDAATPLLWYSLSAGGPGGPAAEDRTDELAADLGNPTDYPFATDVAFGRSAAAFGSWGGAAVLPPSAGAGRVPVALGGGATGEITGLRIADMNGDGAEDVVFAGRTTGVVVVDISSAGSGEDPLHRGIGADVPGLVFHLAVADFDGDGRTDAAVAGSDGVFVVPNLSSETAASRDASARYVEARRCLEVLLDRGSPPDLDDARARARLGAALRGIQDVDPSHLTPEAIAAAGLPRREADFLRLRSAAVYDDVRGALTALRRGEATAAEAALFGPKLEETLRILNRAVLDVGAAGLTILGSPPAKSPREARRVGRLVEDAREAWETASVRTAEADGAVDPFARLPLRDGAMSSAVRALDRVCRALRASNRASR